MASGVTRPGPPEALEVLAVLVGSSGTQSQETEQPDAETTRHCGSEGASLVCVGCAERALKASASWGLTAGLPWSSVGWPVPSSEDGPRPSTGPVSVCRPGARCAVATSLQPTLTDRRGSYLLAPAYLSH